MCCYDEAPEFEIRVNGHSLVQYSDGGIRVDGKNFHTDLKDLSSIIDVLHDILDSAQEAKKPRLVMSEPIIVTDCGKAPIQKAANNN